MKNLFKKIELLRGYLFTPNRKSNTIIIDLKHKFKFSEIEKAQLYTSNIIGSLQLEDCHLDSVEQQKNQSLPHRKVVLNFQLDFD